MGNLVSSTIPNLISGVSQQPWAVRLEAQAEEQINCYSSVTDFMKRRPALNHISRIADSLTHGACVHYINRDEFEKYLCMFSNTGIKVFDLQGNQKTVEISQAGLAYLAKTQDPGNDLRFLTINDYTFTVNTKVTVQKSNDKSPKRNPEAIVFIKQASYNTTYSLTVDGNTTSFTTADGLSPAGEEADPLSSKEIATNLKNGLSTSTYNVTMENSTIWISRKDNADLSVTVEDTRSNTHISAFKTKVQRFSDLPTIGPRGYVVEVTGDSTSAFDNYYVEFIPTEDNVDFGVGIWKECIKQDIEYKLDNTTMPHALIRQADGTFTFDVLEWTHRSCGDEDSAPWPSFVGRKLNSVFFYRNRLSFLSEENVIMSEVGEFFNFFVTTVTTLVDSDLIDVAASNLKSSTLYHAAVFSGGLLLFSEHAQFVFEHDTVLANATVSIRAVTEFEASIKATPVSAGKTVFFATDRGEYGGIREYITLPDSTDQNDAADVTSHVPHYIKGGINKLICSTNEDLLLVLSSQDKQTIWIYKYYWNGNEKIQSSWSKWEIGGDVLGIVFINSNIYMVIQYPEGVYLEVMHIAPDFKDEGETFEYCLDRKVTEEWFNTITYDPLNDVTTITTKSPIPDNLVMVSRGTGGGRLYASKRINSTTLQVSKDIRNIPFYIGVPYTSLYQFSPFALRDTQKGSAITTGRLQLRKLDLNISDTGYIELHVAPTFRKTSVYKFTGKEVGHGSNVLGTLSLYTGTIKCPLLSLNHQVTVTATSNSYLPFALVSATWEGLYSTRSQRA